MRQQNELDIIEEKARYEAYLEKYDGLDRVIPAEEKRLQVEEEAKNRPKFSVKTNIPSLDDCVDGFRKGQLIVVSGPPKNGKTLLCQNFSEAFTEQGERCLWFSYELGYEELFAKFRLKPFQFFVPNQMTTGDLDWVEAKIIEAKLKYGVSVIFIDHLDFLRNPKAVQNVSINLSAYVGAIVQRIKSVAVQQNLVIFLMSHIRKNKWTTGDLPSSEELRDSGQIAQLADIVMMIMRKRATKGESAVYLGAGAIVGIIENRHSGKTIKTDVTLIDGVFVEDKYAGDTNNQKISPKWV